MIRVMDGIRAGRCLDAGSLDLQPGGPVHVFPCNKLWNQFASFGNGNETPNLTIHTNVPLHTRKRIAETGRDQEPYMCLGVSGRGELDEEDWLGVHHEDDDEDLPQANSDEGKTDEIDKDNFSLEEDDSNDDETDSTALSPLSQWEGKQLVSTRCSNTGALIEWLVVPFIVEDYDESITGPEGIDEDEEL
jgi:hypothetical protein